MDPATTQNSVGALLNRQVYNGLVEVNAKGEALPELAESWSSNKSVDEWTFELRKGVEFHNGKSLSSADVIYSIQRHISDDSKSGAKPLLSGVREIKADGPHRVLISLKGGNADLPYVFGDYHLGIVPEGFGNWANPVGTGPFAMTKHEPGVRSLGERNRNYFATSRPYVDSVETFSINDSTARLNALRAGEADIINRVDTRLADLLKRTPGIETVVSPSRTHYCFVMDTRVAPLDNNDVRLALKHAIDRDKILSNVLGGYGSIGNDHSIPEADPFHAALGQHGYDPDKSRFHLRKAGLDKLALDLSAANGAFAGAVDMALLFKEAARKANIDINVVREPDDGYWENIWGKKPFYMSWFGGRPTADMMLTLAYSTGSSWNDTFWSNPEFDKLLAEARITLDTAKRKEMYGEAQRLIRDTGGYIIPVFANLIDAHVSKVGGLTPDINSELMGGRCSEAVWLES
ncbi:MAG: ABC transporter substrate-binding protein [Parvibaculaceae bacterium]